MPDNSDIFIRQLYAYFGLPFSATSVPFLADMAIPANAWTKVNQLQVNPPPTHDFVPIVDPVPSQFINFPVLASPDLSSAGYTVWVFGNLMVNNASGSAAQVYVTVDQGGFGDMSTTQIPTGVTLSMPIVTCAGTNPLGTQLSLWVRSTQAVTLKALTPIVDHSGQSFFGSRLCVVAYPVPH